MTQWRVPGPDGRLINLLLPRMRMAATLALYILALGALTQFCFILYGRQTDWYSQDQKFGWLRNNMTIDFPGNVPLATQVRVGWAGTRN